MRVMGIDPGLRACGVAVCHDGSWWVETIRPRERDLVGRIREICDRGWGVFDLVVIEKPQVYQGRLQKGDPNDLVDLAVLVGALVMRFPCSVVLPRPAEWKHQVPKEIHHKRIRDRVPGLGRCSKDALDAVGLCLYGKEVLNARTPTRR